MQLLHSNPCVNLLVYLKFGLEKLITMKNLENIFSVPNFNYLKWEDAVILKKRLGKKKK